MKISFFLLSLHFLFLFFSPAYGDNKSTKITHCPCEKIIEEKKCENPDCIEICNLQNFFNEIDQLLITQCLEKGVQKKNFSQTETPITDFERLLASSIKKIENIKAENKKILEKNCPECNLFPKIEAQFKSIYTKETCKKEYLKTHSYKWKYQIKLKASATCKKKHKTKIQKSIQNWINNTLREKNNKRSKKLWKECPENCSFNVHYVSQINEEDCSGDLDLKVDCTHQTDTTFLSIPMYDMLITYKENLKCKEN